MILNKDCYNKSCMFKDCSSLIHLKFDNYIYNDEIKYISIYNKDNNIDLNNIKEDSLDEDINIFPYTNIELIPNIKRILREEYKWDTNISVMNEIFYNCSSLISLQDISNFYTINVINMNKFFYNFRNLSFLPDISKWNTENTVDMNKMFYRILSFYSPSKKNFWLLQNYH